MGCKGPTANGDTLQKFPRGSTSVHLRFAVIIVNHHCHHYDVCRVHLRFVVIIVIIVIIVIMMLLSVMTMMKIVDLKKEHYHHYRDQNYHYHHYHESE